MSDWLKLKKEGISDSTIYKLMQNYLNFNEVFEKTEDYLKEKFNLSLEIIEKIYKARNLNIDEELSKLEAKKIKLITLNDKKYPDKLKNISSPPLFLYCKGQIDFPEKSIGVVGTRKMTSYGKSATEKLVKEMVECGITIVSGLAEGVDGAAHNKALMNKGRTIAVVGSGLDVVYPEANRKIWEKMSEEGTIISEYPLGTEPFRWNFPQRNRIIVGLSKGILVAESYEGGGSLITAQIALDEGREVFAVPGFISYPSFEGCNSLIKKSEAKLTTCVKDILEEFGWDEINISEEKIDIVLNTNEKNIYSKLIVEKNLDELIMETGIKSTNLVVILMEMELKGYIKSISGGKYKRNEI